MQNRMIKIKDATFNIFDTETTGNNSFRRDFPIELAYVLFNYNNGIQKEYQTMVDTDLVIHPGAIVTHGITNSLLKSMPKISYDELISTISSDFKETIHVAHNIKFDHSIVPEIVEPETLKVDTLSFARKLFSIGELNSDEMPLSSHKLQELRYWLNIEVDTKGYDAHRALADILVTTEVFKFMLDKFFNLTQNPDATFQDLDDFINAPVLIEICNFKKFAGRTYKEAIKETLEKNDNYFSWLLETKEKESKDDPSKVEENKMIIYTIKHWFKEYNYDPALDKVGSKAGARNFFKK